MIGSMLSEKYDRRSDFRGFARKWEPDIVPFTNQLELIHSKTARNISSGKVKSFISRGCFNVFNEVSCMNCAYARMCNHSVLPPYNTPVGEHGFPGEVHLFLGAGNGKWKDFDAFRKDEDCLRLPSKQCCCHPHCTGIPIHVTQEGEM